jgi:hypothetical protein
VNERLQAGLANWPALAEAEGLPRDGWTPRLLWSRQDSNGDRTVIRLDHPGHAPVICKQAHRASETARMAQGIAAQRSARLAMGDGPPFGVPAVLADLPDRAAALIRAVDADALDDLPGDAAALERAAGWVQAFHTTAALEQAPFWPRAAAKRFLRVVDDVRAGRRPVAAQAEYLRHADALAATIPGLRGRTVTVAPRHGDLSARNILIGAQTVWGIDFSPAAPAAAVIDLSKLLALLAERWPVDVLRGPLCAAFFAGYRLVAPDDPALRFLLRTRLLSAWAGYGPSRPVLPLRDAARFRRIRRLLAAWPG